MKTAQPTNTTNEKQKQRLAFSVYDEEDLLNWDAAIVTPHRVDQAQYGLS